MNSTQKGKNGLAVNKQENDWQPPKTHFTYWFITIHGGI